MKKIDEGLVCTNDNCVGCNKCISVCSCPGATIAAESVDGRNIIKVDGSKCVACGACLDACEHHAREYVDDTMQFFWDLKKGEEISLLVAPAFVANYPNEYKAILGKLKTLGVKRILSVSFGADITTWAYLNYISQNNFYGAISQPCPATVDYIEKYIPELIPKLMPVQSPLMCAAIYARKHMGVTEKLAFISPCIAKKTEISSPRGKGMISYNVTFDHMMEQLRKMEEVEPASFDAGFEHGLGSVYPMPGGLKENLLWFLGEDVFIRTIDGEKRMYQYLNENKSRILDDNSPYTMLDVLNCSDGCLCGTGVENGRLSNEEVLQEMFRIKKTSKNYAQKSAWSDFLTPQERLAQLNRQFQDLDLEDYLCSYTNQSATHIWTEPSTKELDVIFEDMNKSTEESRIINCSCCGYASCKEMAKAIYNGFNHKENCIHFLKDLVSGISADFPTVLLIHGNRQTIHVVKYSGEGAIRSWIDSGLTLIDYNTAMKDYIERYVDDADKERIWENIEFSALQKNLEGVNRYSISYFRHPENGEDGYFQLNFTREEGFSDIILAFQDVNQRTVQQKQNQENLERALAIAERNNEIIGSLSEIYEIIYSVNLEEDSFFKIKAMDEIDAFIKNYYSARECLQAIPEKMFDTTSIGEVQEFCDMTQWGERLKEKDSCYMDAKSASSGWIRITLIVSSRDEDGNARIVLVTLQNVFEEKEREFESYSIINGLSREFSTLWLISLESGLMRLIRSSDRATLGIHTGRELVDQVPYEYAMNHYIDNMVVVAERDKLRNTVSLQNLMQNIPKNGVYTTNFKKYALDGTERYNQMVFTRTMDGNGHENLVLAYRDIDEIVQEEQARERELENALRNAEQANRTKSTFLANMSHEIRTPINAILGMDTMILRESNQESVIEYAKNVKSASDTLLSLINDILDFSKIESGKMEIITGNYRLDSVINDLVNMVKGKAEEKGLELYLRVGENIPAQLIGDEVRIKQIILNILNNAVKYTKEGSITFSVDYTEISANEIDLNISVRDTGIGIKEEDMHILYSPYERIEENRNKLIEGTGLGLSITRNLLEKMDSSLEVESVYGEGSCFSFALRQTLWGEDRVNQVQLQSASSRIVEEEKVFFLAPNAKILVVDDVKMNIIVLESLLKRTKIHPDSCLSGMEALEWAGKNRYDIIFLDAMMPGMNGEETLHEIRKNCPLNAETPIIVLTANAIIGAREKYLEEGFDDYLSKPVDGIKLEKMIHAHLPADKIMEVGEEESAEDFSLADQQIVAALGQHDEISTKDGITATGDVETYLTICRNFYDTASARIEMIRDFFDKKDVSNYTIQVHALKSSARLVGALSLSQQALELEMAGRDNNWELIQNQTASLLSAYKQIVGLLGAALSLGTTRDEEKEELPLKKVKRRYGELLELMEAFDFESAKGLFAEFEKYRMPEETKDVYYRLKSLMADVNRDEVIEVLTAYLER